MTESYDADAVLDAFTRGDYAYVLNAAAPMAERGNADALCMLSFLYQLGFGVEQDACRAEQLLVQAAGQGSALAWNNLATLYLAGLPGVPRDPERAMQCCLRAKELGFDCASPYPPPISYFKRNLE